MTHAPFAGEERGGRLYGRGACDMKAGVAAMCAAAARAHAAGALRGEVVVAAVADEEFESAGTRALVDWMAAEGVRPDACVITEPTRLAVMPAHRGFAWYTVTLRGRAAHGSRYDIGVDAIRHAGLLLAELDALDAEELPRARRTRCSGRGSLHASLIEGRASGLTTYPERCTLRWSGAPSRRERRRGAAELEARGARARAARRARRPFRATSRSTSRSRRATCRWTRRSCGALGAALGAAGEPVRVEGMPAWTDAALLNAAGIPDGVLRPRGHRRGARGRGVGGARRGRAGDGRARAARARLVRLAGLVWAAWRP
jgi:acetylornithine deacetylase